MNTLKGKQNLSMYLPDVREVTVFEKGRVQLQSLGAQRLRRLFKARPVILKALGDLLDEGLLGLGRQTKWEWDRSAVSVVR